MSDDSQKFLISALIGFAGYLASHIFSRIERKGDEQDVAKSEIRVLTEKVARLEEDLRDVKRLIFHRIKEDYDEA